MSSTTETVKERLGIVDVVSSYVTLEKAGSNMKARCPFHNEKTPSFMVSPARNTYYCFGCNSKGDIFTFVQEIEGLDFGGALTMLAERAGVPIVRERKEIRDARERLYALLEAATFFFEKGLQENTSAQAYLKDRGLHDATLKAFRVGYTGEGWHNLKDFLQERSFTDGEMEHAGIIKKGDRGHYDRFRERIMFPITDSSGKIVAFSGRFFGSSDKEGDTAKYLNSPETPLFHKSNILYGYDKAKSQIRKLNFTLVVEGQMDLLLSHQAGFRNTVALSGTALTSEQVALLLRVSSNVVLAFDRDTAGISATGRSADIALDAGMDVKVAVLPKGADPADVIQEDPDMWKGVIRDATHVIEFYLAMLRETAPNERAFRKEVARIVLPYVSRIQNAIDRAHFVSLIAQRLGIGEPSVWEALAKLPQKNTAERVQDHRPQTQGASDFQTTGADEANRQKTLLYTIAAVLKAIQTHSDTDNITVHTKAKLRALLGEGYSRMLPNEEELSQEFLFKIESAQVTLDYCYDTLEELLGHLEKECLREQFENAMQTLRAAEAASDNERVSKALAKCNDLSRQLAVLTSGKVV